MSRLSWKSWPLTVVLAVGGVTAAGALGGVLGGPVLGLVFAFWGGAGALLGTRSLAVGLHATAGGITAAACVNGTDAALTGPVLAVVLLAVGLYWLARGPVAPGRQGPPRARAGYEQYMGAAKPPAPVPPREIYFIISAYSQYENDDSRALRN
jgi:hypothetical protein